MHTIETQKNSDLGAPASAPEAIQSRLETTDTSSIAPADGSAKSPTDDVVPGAYVAPAPALPRPGETPSAWCLREVRELLERHRGTGRTEFGHDLSAPPPTDPTWQRHAADGLNAQMVVDVLDHLFAAIEMQRRMDVSSIFSPSERVEVHGRIVQRPPSMRILFGEAFDVPCQLPAIGTAPQRWRILASANHDFYEECLRGSAIRGEDHDARDAAADAIAAAGRWPTQAEVRAAIQTAREDAKRACMPVPAAPPAHALPQKRKPPVKKKAAPPPARKTRKAVRK